MDMEQLIKEVASLRSDYAGLSGKVASLGLMLRLILGAIIPSGLESAGHLLRVIQPPTPAPPPAPVYQLPAPAPPAYIPPAAAGCDPNIPAHLQQGRC